MELTKGKLATLVTTLCNQGRGRVNVSTQGEGKESRYHNLKFIPVVNQLQQVPFFFLEKEEICGREIYFRTLG